MRWKAKCDHFGWRKRFAWVPVRIGDEVIWWEHYWARFMGEYREVALISQWPHCCEQMRGEMQTHDRKLLPEWCPVHAPNGFDGSRGDTK
jgi:hypothetical protein